MNLAKISRIIVVWISLCAIVTTANAHDSGAKIFDRDRGDAILQITPEEITGLWTYCPSLVASTSSNLYEIELRGDVTNYQAGQMANASTKELAGTVLTANQTKLSLLATLAKAHGLEGKKREMLDSALKQCEFHIKVAREILDN